MSILRTASILAAIATLSGCELVGGSDPKSNAVPQEQTDATGITAVKSFGSDDVAADSTVAALKGGPDSTGRLSDSARQNLLAANATFHKALAANPDDPKAAFGVAVSSLGLKVDDLSDSLKKMWDRGLRVGGAENPADMFRINPTVVASNGSFSARAFSDPRNAPKISELQSLLDTKLMPTVDSAILFLTRCWDKPDFKYQFHVKVNNHLDTITIGRADVGLALVGLRTAKAYFTWILAQNVDVDFDGSYDWFDTLGHIDDDIGPATAAQEKALENLKSLLAPGSSFMTLRTDYVARVNALPAELISISALAKQVGDAAVLQRANKSGLLRPTASENAELQEYADSARIYLSGMHTYTRPAHTEYDEVYNTSCIYPNNCWTPVRKDYPGFTIRANVAKLITLNDKKVFMPRYAWNSSADWASKGAYSVVKGLTVTPIANFKSKIDIETPIDLDPYLEWADPTFGGVFEFTSSHAVLEQLEAMDEKPVTTGIMPLLPPL